MHGIEKTDRRGAVGRGRTTLIATIALTLLVGCLAVAGCSPQGESDAQGTQGQTGGAVQEPGSSEASGGSQPSDDASGDTPGGASQANAPSSAGSAWGAETDCASCHGEASGAPAEGSSGTASYHVADGLTDCFDCHVDEDALAEVHEKAEGTPPSKLKHTSVDAAVCLACHDKSAVATATEGSSVLTDNNGTVANPHALPESGDHGSITCLSCHSGHDDASLEKEARGTCTSCHHDNVYECHTCHD